MLLDLGRRDEAGRLLDEARGEFEGLVRDDPKSPNHRFDLSRARVVRAVLARNAGQMPEAFQGFIAGRDLQLGVATDPASDPTTAAACRDALLGLGSLFCRHGLWEEADAALEPALALAKPGDANEDLMAGLNRLLLRDEAGYRRIRDRARSRYRSTDSPYMAADLAMLAAIRPDPTLDRAALVAMAERGLDVTGQEWPKVYLALAYLRAGQLELAAKQLDNYDKTSPAGVERVDEITALSYAVRAMVAHRLGRADDARLAMVRCRRLLDDLGIRFLEWPLGDHGTGFWGWAACSIVIAEATAEIEGRPERPEPWTDLMNAWGESQIGRNDRARAALSRIAPEDAKTAGVRAARAHVLVALGDNDRAREDVEAAIRLEPENVLADHPRPRGAGREAGRGGGRRTGACPGKMARQPRRVRPAVGRRPSDRHQRRGLRAGRCASPGRSASLGRAGAAPCLARTL